MAASVFSLFAKNRVCNINTFVFAVTIFCCSKLLSLCHFIILCANGDNHPRILPNASLHSPASTGSLAENPTPLSLLLRDDLTLNGNIAARAAAPRVVSGGFNSLRLDSKNPEVGESVVSSSRFEILGSEGWTVAYEEETTQCPIPKTSLILARMDPPVRVEPRVGEPVEGPVEGAEVGVVAAAAECSDGISDESEAVGELGAGEAKEERLVVRDDLADAFEGDGVVSEADDVGVGEGLP
ncbi:hypothetical protein G2W53_026150 [Senna tora]|uniref:Uncharacterized protein n=1 Tax=Senna tora TaxID=362788 RepID=A0A834TF69_9FABA|nr:hypothetical protein G2W53_026150 [Senna tora]